MATEQTKVGERTTEAPAPPVSEPGASREGQGVERGKAYDEAYVKALRDEAAAHRVRAKRAEDAEDRLRTLAVIDAAKGLLTDPSDLPWSDDLADEEGWPDAARIRAAAEQLVEAKPHLGRPAGDVGQGRHSDDEPTVNLADLLRAGA